MIENSFIETINIIKEKLPAIIEANNLFDTDIIASLDELSGLDISLITADLKKGNYLGNRKIDIDIALNNQSEIEEVTYQSATLTMNNGIVLDIPFETTNEVGDTVVEEIASYTGLYTKILAGIQSYNTNEEDAQKHIVNYEIDVVNETIAELPTLLRFRDVDGSACNIDRISLSVFQGGSPVVQNPAYYWNQTTSALEVLANRVGDIIALGQDIDKIIALADKEDEIQYLYDTKITIQTLADNVQKIIDVEANLVSINAVNANKINIDAVNANKTNIDAVNANKTNIDAVSLNTQNITSTATNEQNISAVADNELNINTVKNNLVSVVELVENMDDINNALANANTASTKADEATKIRDEIVNISPTVNLLASGEAPSISYNSATGGFILYMPQGLKGDRGESFTIDATGTLVERDLYDGSSAGFAYMALDSAPTLVYFKKSDTAGDWTLGIPFGQGERGIGILAVTQTAGDGSAGSTDTYTVTLEDSSVAGTFTVTNGAIPTKADLGLDLVDNTSDINKPISTATLTELNKKATIVYTDTELDKKIDKTSVLDTLTSIDTTKPLSANQGKVLKGLFDAINTLLLSDNATLDSVQEIVNFIEINKDTLDTLGIASIAGLQTALNGKQQSGTYNTVIGTDTDLNTAGSTIIDNIYVTDGVITSMGTRVLSANDLAATVLKSTNGYVKLPGGIILQWGRSTANAVGSTVNSTTFPIAFPTACRSVTANHNGTEEYINVAITSVTTTTLRMETNHTSGVGCFWTAVGY